MVAGIYKYTNKRTDALYIGSAKNIQKRHQAHLNPLAIDVAIANEGFKNFTFEIIEELPPNKDILLKAERKWIDYYDAENNPLHYNRGSSNNKIIYSLWDAQKVNYNKGHMFRNNSDGRRPRRCFRANVPTKGNEFTYRLPIGLFNEFVSPEIIYDLCQKWS